MSHLQPYNYDKGAGSELRSGLAKVGTRFGPVPFSAGQTEFVSHPPCVDRMCGCAPSNYTFCILPEWTAGIIDSTPCSVKFYGPTY